MGLWINTEVKHSKLSFSFSWHHDEITTNMQWSVFIGNYTVSCHYVFFFQYLSSAWIKLSSLKDASTKSGTPSGIICCPDGFILNMSKCFSLIWGLHISSVEKCLNCIWTRPVPSSVILGKINCKMVKAFDIKTAVPIFHKWILYLISIYLYKLISRWIFFCFSEIHGMLLIVLVLLLTQSL